MDNFEQDLNKVLIKELSRKQGGSIGSVVGKLVGKIIPLVTKHAPNILPALGMAAVTGAISGSTHKAVAGSGNYQEHGLMLTDGQKQKLQSAKEGITLRLTRNQLSGNDVLLLTKTQINKIQKSQRLGVGMDLKLSASQMKKQGGFLGALAAGLAAPLIGKFLGMGNGKGMMLPGANSVAIGTKRGRGRPKKTSENHLLPQGKGLRLPGS